MKPQPLTTGKRRVSKRRMDGSERVSAYEEGFMEKKEAAS